MPRGGKRTGTPGATYSNRSDLQGGPRVLPAATVPGQPYGAQAEQKRSMAAVPMASGAIPSEQSATPPVPEFTGHDPSVPSPGSLPPLDAPTERPHESVMTGAYNREPSMRPSDVLAQLAPADLNGEIADLLAFARQMGM